MKKIIISLLFIISAQIVAGDGQKPLALKDELFSFQAKKDADSDEIVTRNGLILKRPGADAVVFVMHGFMCDKHDASFLRTVFPHYHIVTFDFRAHGKDTKGQCCSFGYNESFDVAGAVNYIRSLPEFKDLPRVGYAFSMGAVATIMAQSRDNSLFDVLVLDCPFESTGKLMDRLLDKIKFSFFGYEFGLPLRSLFKKYAFNSYVQSILKFLLKSVAKMSAQEVTTCMISFDPANEAKKITKPTFLIGCKKDEKVPVEGFMEVYNNINAYKRLWITNGRRHFDSYFSNPELYTYKVNRFIDKVLGQELEHREQSKVMRDSDHEQQRRFAA